MRKTVRKVRSLRHSANIYCLCILTYLSLYACKDIKLPECTTCNQNQIDTTVPSSEVDDRYKDTLRFDDHPIQTYRSIDYDTTLWTEIVTGDHFRIDLKYATEDNFTEQQIYDCGRCFVRPRIATVLLEVSQRVVKEKGWSLLLYDCYRPRSAQRTLWDIKPDPTYVMHPDKGSMHNRGAAVDLSFVDAEGDPLDMGTQFDHFGREARHSYTELPVEIIDRRAYLRDVMESVGFRSIKSEWWHYSLSGTGAQLTDWEWKCDE